MKANSIACLLALVLSQANGDTSAQSAADDSSASTPEKLAIQSRVIRTDAQDLVLEQVVLIDAPVKEVWAAYSTEEGWKSWASPVVEIDLRTGGTIQTHYSEEATIGDAGTNVLHIVNYVPERLLTLQAEVGERWPEVMKEDADNLMNVVVFEAQGDARTKILSYGVGYKDSDAYKQLMDFFIPANEGLFQRLKEVLED